MASNDKELLTDLSPFLLTYKNGVVERLISSPFIPPSPETHPTAGVCSKDITISDHVSARLYIPHHTLTTTTNNRNTTNKLPIFVYYHGGGFCLESAFCALFHNYVNSIVSKSQSLIVVSVEYRLAPENPLPIAYEDSWVALNWVSSHSDQKTQPQNRDQWILDFADFDQFYIGGDSAGGNIVYNIAIRSGFEKLKGDVKISGGILSFPHFWGSKAIRSEQSENRGESWLSRVWRVVYPNSPGGDDNPAVNPLAEDAAVVAGMGLRRMMVVVAERDGMRDRGVEYVEYVKRCGWSGVVELVEYDGEEHCFHLFDPQSQNSKDLINHVVSFVG